MQTYRAFSKNKFNKVRHFCDSGLLVAVKQALILGVTRITQFVCKQIMIIMNKYEQHQIIKSKKKKSQQLLPSSKRIAGGKLHV